MTPGLFRRYKVSSWLILSALAATGCLQFDSGDPPTRIAKPVDRIVDMGPQPHRTDFFLHDDALVASSTGLSIRPGRISKHPSNPVFVADKPWERGRLNYTCVIYDREEKIFKMWYQMIIPEDGNNKSWCHYARSADGVTWEKPNVGIVEFEGSKANNILFEQLEGIRGTPSYWVYKDYAEPAPAKRYKMMLQSWGFQGRSALIAYSPDGVHWTMPQYGNLPGPFDSQNGIFWDEATGEYVGYFRSHERGYRSISRATSPDAFHWSRPVTVHTVDDRDPPTWHLYIPSVFKYFEARNTYVMLPTGFDDTSHAMYPQLGVSRDGVNWHRFREPFIPVGPEGSWDAGHTRALGSENVIDGQTAIFYYAATVRGHEKGGKRGIGIALMHEGGYVGRHAAGEGTLVTHQLRARRYYDKFFLNAEAEGGSIHAELLGPSGDVLEGFSRDDVEPITTNGSLIPVVWKGSDEVMESHMRRGPVHLKLYLQRATVYGFRCVRPPDAAH